MEAKISPNTINKAIKNYKNAKAELKAYERALIEICRKCTEHREAAKDHRCNCEIQEMLDKLVDASG